MEPLRSAQPSGVIGKRLRPCPSSPCSIRSGVVWMPTSTMQRVVASWHEALGTDIEIQYAHALQRLATLLPEGRLPKWSLFAGTGLSSKICKALEAVWRNKYGVAITVDDALYCELNKAKQEFLREQHEPRFLVADANELAMDSAKNISIDEHGHEEQQGSMCLTLPGYSV